MDWGSKLKGFFKGGGDNQTSQDTRLSNEAPIPARTQTQPAAIQANIDMQKKLPNPQMQKQSEIEKYESLKITGEKEQSLNKEFTRLNDNERNDFNPELPHEKEIKIKLAGALRHFCYPLINFYGKDGFDKYKEYLHKLKDEFEKNTDKLPMKYSYIVDHIEYCVYNKAIIYENSKGNSEIIKQYFDEYNLQYSGYKLHKYYINLPNHLSFNNLLKQILYMRDNKTMIFDEIFLKKIGNSSIMANTLTRNIEDIEKNIYNKKDLIKKSEEYNEKHRTWEMRKNEIIDKYNRLINLYYSNICNNHNVEKKILTYFFEDLEKFNPKDERISLDREKQLFNTLPGNDKTEILERKKFIQFLIQRMLNFVDPEYKNLSVSAPMAPNFLHKTFIATKVERKKITMEQLLGKKGLEKYKAALQEEMNSLNFKKEIIRHSYIDTKVLIEKGPFASENEKDTIKKWPGWNEKCRLIVAGASGVGKTFNSRKILTYLIFQNVHPQTQHRKNSRISSNSNAGIKDFISIDGGLIREVSQMRKAVLQCALTLGYAGILDLQDNTKLDTLKKNIREHIKSKDIHIIEPLTYAGFIYEKLGSFVRNPTLVHEINTEPYSIMFANIIGNHEQTRNNRDSRAWYNGEYSAHPGYVFLNNMKMACESKNDEGNYNHGKSGSKRAQKEFYEQYKKNYGGTKAIITISLKSIQDKQKAKTELEKFRDKKNSNLPENSDIIPNVPFIMQNGNVIFVYAISGFNEFDPVKREIAIANGEAYGPSGSNPTPVTPNWKVTSASQSGSNRDTMGSHREPINSNSQPRNSSLSQSPSNEFSMLDKLEDNHFGSLFDEPIARNSSSIPAPVMPSWKVINASQSVTSSATMGSHWKNSLNRRGSFVPFAQPTQNPPQPTPLRPLQSKRKYPVNLILNKFTLAQWEVAAQIFDILLTYRHNGLGFDAFINDILSKMELKIMDIGNLSFLKSKEFYNIYVEEWEEKHEELRSNYAYEEIEYKITRYKAYHIIIYSKKLFDNLKTSYNTTQNIIAKLISNKTSMKSLHEDSSFIHCSQVSDLYHTIKELFIRMHKIGQEDILNKKSSEAIEQNRRKKLAKQRREEFYQQFPEIPFGPRNRTVSLNETKALIPNEKNRKFTLGSKCINPLSINDIQLHKNEIISKKEANIILSKINKVQLISLENLYDFIFNDEIWKANPYNKTPNSVYHIRKILNVLPNFIVSIDQIFNENKGLFSASIQNIPNKDKFPLKYRNISFNNMDDKEIIKTYKILMLHVRQGEINTFINEQKIISITENEFFSKIKKLLPMLIMASTNQLNLGKHLQIQQEQIREEQQRRENEKMNREIEIMNLELDNFLDELKLHPKFY